MILRDESQQIVLFGVRINPEKEVLTAELGIVTAGLTMDKILLSDEKGKNHYWVWIPNGIKNRNVSFVAEKIHLRTL